MYLLICRNIAQKNGTLYMSHNYATREFKSCDFETPNIYHMMLHSGANCMFSSVMEITGIASQFAMQSRPICDTSCHMRRNNCDA